MKHLLDTSVCVGLLRGKAQGALKRLADSGPDECALCSIVVFELEYGAKRSNQPDVEALKVRMFVAGFDSLAFDDECARVAAELRVAVEKSGCPIGPLDLLIAATALRHGLHVVTQNTKEFERVPGLTVENWEASL